ncbi:MAG: hypothetical protein IPI44_24485 [Sulfuritalea sp.]|nr:hypothetical protein [Sulfuritalea sp.]
MSLAGVSRSGSTETMIILVFARSSAFRALSAAAPRGHRHRADVGAIDVTEIHQQHVAAQGFVERTGGAFRTKSPPAGRAAGTRSPVSESPQAAKQHGGLEPATEEQTL